MTKHTKLITRSEERMHSSMDWLDSRHSFSFGGHYDAERMGFGSLRVVNQDVVAPGSGFSRHPHRDMEIISIVLDGQLEHEDSLGNGRVIEAGDIQYMSAGSGVIHSEFNPSSTKPAHFLQIWIQPNAIGLEPRYADQPLVGAVDNEWSLVLSPDGRDGSVAIRQDVELRSVHLKPEATVSYRASGKDRGLWVLLIEGAVSFDGETLEAGDSVALTGYDLLELKPVGETSAKVLMFDLAV